MAQRLVSTIYYPCEYNFSTPGIQQAIDQARNANPLPEDVFPRRFQDQIILCSTELAPDCVCASLNGTVTLIRATLCVIQDYAARKGLTLQVRARDD